MLNLSSFTNVLWPDLNHGPPSCQDFSKFWWKYRIPSCYSSTRSGGREAIETPSRYSRLKQMVPRFDSYDRVKSVWNCLMIPTFVCECQRIIAFFISEAEVGRSRLLRLKFFGQSWEVPFRGDNSLKSIYPQSRSILRLKSRKLRRQRASNQQEQWKRLEKDRAEKGRPF